MNPLRRYLIARGIRRELKRAREMQKQCRRDGVVLGRIESIQVEVTSVTLPSGQGLNPEPGRQRIMMPAQHDGLGFSRPWAPPVPADARSAPWSDLHRYAVGVTERQRDPRGMMIGQEPPLALVCPGCELDQTPLFADRICGYCGLVMKLHGPRIFWWRIPVEVAEWAP